jgi:hypothetical protein
MSLQEIYTPTETSTTEWFAMDARELSNGAMAIVDHAGRVLEIVRGAMADDAAEWAAQVEHTCPMCDGLGHAYPVGREHFTNGTSRIITGGGPCPLEERGRR